MPKVMRFYLPMVQASRLGIVLAMNTLKSVPLETLTLANMPSSQKTRLRLLVKSRVLRALGYVAPAVKSTMRMPKTNDKTMHTAANTKTPMPTKMRH